MCPDGSGSSYYTDDAPCTFTRKLCVTCKTKSDGLVYIRFQGNTYPNHCFQAINANPTESTVDWEVVFNRDVTAEENYSSSDIASEAAVSELLCDI